MTHFYPMASSARARIDGGTVRPSALAVLRLTTSSNVVGCSTGRSAGFALLENFVDVDRGTSVMIGQGRPVRHQAIASHKGPLCIIDGSRCPRAKSAIRLRSVKFTALGSTRTPSRPFARQAPPRRRCELLRRANLELERWHPSRNAFAGGLDPHADKRSNTAPSDR